MKNIIFCIAMILHSLNTDAKQWTVTNNTRNKADFYSLSQAVNSEEVLTGDTILLCNSQQRYIGTQLTKNLVFMPQESNPDFMPTITYFTLNSGSAGARFIRLHIQTVQYNVARQSVEMQQCRIAPFIYRPYLQEDTPKSRRLENKPLHPKNNSMLFTKE